METGINNNSAFWGMIIYERRGNGTLIGEWKNNGHPNGTILSEIARKNDGSEGLDGDYVVSWIEETNLQVNGTLIISIIENGNALSFLWTENGAPRFRGLGMPIGLHQIAVTYWGTDLALNLRFI